MSGSRERFLLTACRIRFAQILASSTEESEVPDDGATRMMSLLATLVSSTLEGPLDWPNATVESGDAVDVVTRLKEESRCGPDLPGCCRLRPGAVGQPDARRPDPGAQLSTKPPLTAPIDG
jgi:hypothetical protein